MERTGGEPDVVGHDKNTGNYIFYDCSEQSPKGRRNVCYDREGPEARKLNGRTVSRVAEVGNFDTKTLCWVKTPSDIRDLAVPSLLTRRHGSVLVDHNSAPS